jgi:hypothetical protein
MRFARVLGLLMLLLTLHAAEAGAPVPREPAVAGQFYPADPARLEAAVRGLLADALPPRGEPPIALVLPHAGYIYSGQIAADGYRHAMTGSYDLVVVLGTNHTDPAFRGVSIYAGTGFRTPLGVAEVDTRLANDLLGVDPEFVFEAGVHRLEHSIEVQVPFVQVAFPGVKILPVIVARPDPDLCERFGRALARAVGRRKVLVIASSDLAHYPAYDDARASDAAVLSAIAALDGSKLVGTVTKEMRTGRPNLETCACGEGPILAAIAAAKALGATRGVVLSYANSGDTAVGNLDRVVGYGAVALSRGTPGADVSALKHPESAPSDVALGSGDKNALLLFARRSIERLLATDTAPLARGFPPAVSRKAGVFVTLYKHGGLRGCIGRMEPDLPLGQVTGMMALNAAFADPRFPPLEASELAEIEIEVSVLTPLVRVSGSEAIKIGEDGVVMRKGGRAAVFLPQVPVEEGWDRTALLEHLCSKAGLPAGAWTSGAEFYTFHSTHFRESDRH